MPSRPLARALPLIVAAALIGRATEARAEDVVAGRATLLASYGAIFSFVQDADRGFYDPDLHHGLELRAGGERCWGVCVGLSAIGMIPVQDRDVFTGGLSVGPHIAYDGSGPAWGGPLTIRLGATYSWLNVATWLPEDEREQSEDEESTPPAYSALATQHGVGGWVELTLELMRPPVRLSPIIGLRVGYTAVVSDTPVQHILSAQAVFGFSVTRRLVFGEGEELDPDEDAPVEDEDDDELDPEEERRLRDAEETLRGF